MTRELAMLVGLPGAGKSSFCRARFAATHVRVSKDELRARREDPRSQTRLIAPALAAGRSVVIDNVNAGVADRASLIALARTYEARVVAYWLDVSVADCLARNCRREGGERVPDVAVHALRGKLVPPRLTEGFDAVYRVRLAPERGFAVELVEGATG